ncbi:MAG: sucrase ferredoxin, partial [Chloroflexota bacterium]
MDLPATPTAYCSDLSAGLGEPLAGTASQTEAYLLLEYPGTWGEKALEESTVPEPVKQHLKRLGKQMPTLKTLLVRSGLPQRQPGVRFFIASTRAGEAQIYAFHLSAYEGSLEIDIPAVLSGGAGYAAYRRRDPLALVCTNGRRDVCCARKGAAAFSTLLAAAHDSPDPLVWHCSHIGGHRFAANVLLLPHGLLYGRVGVAEAGEIWRAYQRGEIVLDNLRGRTAYPPALQAAEHAIRSQTGRT